MAPFLPHSPSSEEDIILSSLSEERKGLLSGVDSLPILEAEKTTPSSLFDGGRTFLSFGPARIALAISTLLGLVLGISYWLFSPPCSAKALHFNGDSLRSNGTHEFKRTVLLVSIDGLRYAFFDAYTSLRR